jgi:hypothetical protein
MFPERWESVRRIPPLRQDQAHSGARCAACDALDLFAYCSIGAE